MKLGSALFILTSLVGIVVITKHSAATAGYEKILELGREHRREELQNPVVTGTVGWRRRRSIKESNPTLDEKTAKSFASGSQQKK